jgi:hypothetical protein
LLEWDPEHSDASDAISHHLQELMDVDPLLHVIGQMEMVVIHLILFRGALRS